MLFVRSMGPILSNSLEVSTRSGQAHYILRPPLALHRRSMGDGGRLLYRMKRARAGALKTSSRIRAVMFFEAAVPLGAGAGVSFRFISASVAELGWAAPCGAPAGKARRASILCRVGYRGDGGGAGRLAGPRSTAVRWQRRRHEQRLTHWPFDAHGARGADFLLREAAMPSILAEPARGDAR